MTRYVQHIPSSPAARPLSQPRHSENLPVPEEEGKQQHLLSESDRERERDVVVVVVGGRAIVYICGRRNGSGVEEERGGIFSYLRPESAGGQ